MTEYDKAALKALAERDGAAAGDRPCGPIWQERPTFTVGWRQRARRTRAMGLAVCAVLAASIALPVIVSAVGLDAREASAGPEAASAAPAAFAPLSARTAAAPARPERKEAYGPEYIEFFGPERMVFYGPVREALDTGTTGPDGLEVLPGGEVEDALSGNEVREPEPSRAAPAVETARAEPASAAGQVDYGKMSDYPVAAQVYARLSAAGWSDVCIAGVLGNMMTECGGQTLALEPYCEYWDDGVKYYGLCQWSMTYNAAVDGLDVDRQIDYLFGNIEKNMAYFGGDGAYGRWLSSTDAGQAARDFCGWYERGSATDKRVQNAGTAYDWIMAAK